MKSPIRDLCDQARQDRRLALLLEACLTDPVASRALLLHRTELFPRLEIPIEGSMITIAAGGLPFLSESPKLIRRSLKDLAGKYAAHSSHPERMAEAQDRMASAEAAIAESVRDAFALAILNTVSANPPLLELVNRPRPIDRPRLRQAVKDYSGIDWSPATALLAEAFSALFQTDKSRKPVQQLLIHIDVLKDAVDLDRFKAQVVDWLSAHFHRLLQIRGVHHDDWAGLVQQLHEDRVLEHAGPLYFLVHSVRGNRRFRDAANIAHRYGPVLPQMRTEDVLYCGFPLHRSTDPGVGIARWRARRGAGLASDAARY